jgi:hypothetical protein
VHDAVGPEILIEAAIGIESAKASARADRDDLPVWLRHGGDSIAGDAGDSVIAKGIDQRASTEQRSLLKNLDMKLTGETNR